MKERFIENNIEYIIAEDGMYYPHLQLPEDNGTRPIGLYGSLRKTYLYLADINEAALDYMDLIVKHMTEQQSITEQLKSSKWLKWLQAMNNIQASASELVFSEIVYA